MKRLALALIAACGAPAKPFAPPPSPPVARAIDAAPADPQPYPAEWNICSQLGSTDFDGTIVELVSCDDGPENPDRSPGPVNHHAYLVERRDGALAAILQLRDYETGEWGSSYRLGEVLTANGHSAVLVWQGGLGHTEVTGYAIQGGEWRPVYTTSGEQIEAEEAGSVVVLQFCEHCSCVMLMGCDPSNPPPEVHHLETLQWDGETLSSISSQPKANTP